jgi:hypothetical protein
MAVCFGYGKDAPHNQHFSILFIFCILYQLDHEPRYLIVKSQTSEVKQSL